MRKTKPFLTILSVCALSFSLSLNSFSVSADSVNDYSSKYEINIDDEISKAINGETDLEIDISKHFKISSVCENSEETDIYYTTTKLNDCASGQDFDTYATTILSSAKTSHGSSVNSTYHVTAWLTIYWTDDLGYWNHLNSVSGGWSVEPGYSVSFSNRTLKTRGWDDAPHYSSYVYNYPSNNTFSYEVDSLLPSNIAYHTFQAESSVKLNSTSTMTLYVETSIFD